MRRPGNPGHEEHYWHAGPWLQSRSGHRRLS
jgi:hypothetical protein